ncbi:diaminopimelate decarboxylase [Candidatus Methanoplasma termitum]|uniref:Diaminopimelate decarboxylase n=1 Tax=Candidatus Methanoplasma termitum TaxID=1577791 RepID=A0A0A7LEN6_9ARCH|nr:diaminopimelate decarboxylase [Candidatus Methanoplasma termitum]AIZ55991.1 diaminopimelate decarboxylase [Candidatus Methanoplasma termitum]
MRNFESKNGVMMFGGIPVTDIAKEFGTPVYVTEEKRLRENYRNIYNAFSKHMDTRINYACKANTNLAILKILESEGCGIDAVSVGEVMTCLKAGFDPDKIMYTGVNVSNEELKAVTDMGVMINVDSASELERLAKINRSLPISFRITPDVGSGHSAKVVTGSKGSKFGIPKSQVIKTYLRAKELGFKIKGIHAHIGSGGLTVEPFVDVVEVLIEITNKLKEKGIDLEFIDIGGGIGVPYHQNEPEMDINDLGATLTEMILEGTDVRTILLEPGRYIVCDSTVLLTKCVDVKDAGVKKYIGVDAGFNTLVRPAMYDSYHHVEIGNKFGKACTAKYDVVGPICESGDHLAHDRVLPDPDEGDIVVVYDAGAYGFSMSSNYNTRPLCREVLVNGGKAELIRESETVEEQWRHQRIPARLMR